MFCSSNISSRFPPKYDLIIICKKINQTCIFLAGTCRCGSSTDRNAVVSERLRVLNINNLRVIDGSIMPQVINANSWPATAMIAEYGAQMVRDDNRI